MWMWMERWWRWTFEVEGRRVGLADWDVTW